MSLVIEIDDVTAVLLADGWHEVADRSFYTDSYEYIESHAASPDRDPFVDLGGGCEPKLPARGFGLRESDGTALWGLSRRLFPCG